MKHKFYITTNSKKSYFLERTTESGTSYINLKGFSLNIDSEFIGTYLNKDSIIKIIKNKNLFYET